MPQLPLLILMICMTGCAEEICNPKDLQGPFAFQLTGETTISGERQPASSVGKLVFDGSGSATSFSGSLSGSASVMFAGYLLGNPVTGSFEAHSDCTVAWTLQDDGGGAEHFAGRITPDGKRVEFSQTDHGAARHGVMIKTATECKASDLAKTYGFDLAGNSSPMTEGDRSGGPVHAKGIIRSAGDANFKLELEGKPPLGPDVVVTVDEDCTVHLELELPPEDGAVVAPSELRGVLVNGGREILAIQTDPGFMVSARFTAK